MRLINCVGKLLTHKLPLQHLTCRAARLFPLQKWLSDTVWEYIVTENGIYRVHDRVRSSYLVFWNHKTPHLPRSIGGWTCTTRRKSPYHPLGVCKKVYLYMYKLDVDLLNPVRSGFFELHESTSSLYIHISNLNI